MEFKLTRLSVAMASAALLSLASCGGGSDSNPAAGPANPQQPPSTGTTIPGTAAIGQPIVGSVVAIDINGKVSAPATTTDAGAFVLDVNGLTAPYILSITGTAGGKQVTLNSIATGVGQTVNITPLTDLIVSTASGQPGGSTLASQCTPVANVVPQGCLSALAAAATPANLTAAITAVKEMIAPLNTANIDPLNGAFTANGTGFDALLDQILVSPAAAQGATATITLIATNKPLGTVTLPATAGQTSTTQVTAPTQQELTTATAAATVLPEIRACMASFNKLYEKTGFTTPSQTRVEDFLDDSLDMGFGGTKAAFAAFLSGEGAVPGSSLEPVGFAPFDMSLLTTTETGLLPTTRVGDILKARTSGAIEYTNGSPTGAWIQLKPTMDAGTVSMKMVKGSAYDGCPGGWKMAGTKHADMHMNARIRRTLNSSGEATFTREWAFHIEKDDSAIFDHVMVRGPGLTTYTGNSTAPASTTKAPLTLNVSGDSTISWLVVGTGQPFYQNAEAIRSCQDLVGTSAGPGTPCIDETQVAPGMLYSWVLMKKSGVTGVAPTVIQAFPFQITSVPLSTAFAKANQKDLFATVTSITPAGISALNTAISNFAGDVLDDFFTINYTQSATYGSRADNCSVGLFNGGSALMRAEQNAFGGETSCTFKTSTLNSGSLSKPGVTVSDGFIGVTTIVLGNAASTSQPY